VDSIWAHIAASNVKAAEEQLHRFGAVFEMLLQNPHAGRSRPDWDQICAALQLSATS
jgi:toxin ParE1/3/4